MSPEIHWLANDSMSCFHAAEVLHRNPAMAEPRMAAAIAEPTELLVKEVSTLGLSEKTFWEHVIPLSARFGGNRELADLALRKCGRKMDNSSASRLESRIGELELAVNNEFPTLTEDVTLWGRGLRDQWMEFGPTLLQTIGRRIEVEVLVANAEIVLVYPMQRGAGSAHVLYNSVRIEAVESDPEQKLPEVIRLAWLVSQLNLDLPMFSETINAHHLPLVAGLATLPAALSAAESVELAACDQPNIELALATWMPHFRPSQKFAEQLLTWWEMYGTKRPPFSVAIGALDQMLPDETL